MSPGFGNHLFQHFDLEYQYHCTQCTGRYGVHYAYCPEFKRANSTVLRVFAKCSGGIFDEGLFELLLDDSKDVEFLKEMLISASPIRT